MAVEQTSLGYTGKGVDILGRVIIGGILMVITLGLYTPWYINGLVRYVCQHVKVENAGSGKKVGVDFTGSGMDLLGRFILWEILVLVTLGLYTPWMLNGFYGYIVENITVRTTE